MDMPPIQIDDRLDEKTKTPLGQGSTNGRVNDILSMLKALMTYL